MTDSAIGSGYYKTSQRNFKSIATKFMQNFSLNSDSYSIIKPLPVQFDKIVYEHLNLALKTPIILQVEIEGGYYVVRYPELGMIVAEKNLDELCASFQEDFASLWYDYALEQDENLTENAILLKRELRSLTTGV